jgi:hypothetical protein
MVMSSFLKFIRKKRSVKFWLFTALVIFFVYFEFMSFTGGCYKEFRYLSERELIARFVNYPTWSSKTKEEKAALINDQSLNNYCCRVGGEDIMIQDFSIIEKILGNYWYSIHIVAPRKGDKRYSMYESVSSVNGCGVPSNGSFGTSLTKKEFTEKLESNKTYFFSEKQR